MRDHLAAIFAEHDTPTHASKREVHDQLPVILKLAADVQKQVLEYRMRVTAAQLHPDLDPALDAKLEFMHQTVGAMEREAAPLLAHGRNLAASMQQLDRFMATWKDELEQYERAHGAPAQASTTASADER